MAICPHCSQEMTQKISCRSDPIIIDETAYEPVRWGSERNTKAWVIDFPCRDCGTPVGGVHHPGCCVERCPVCLGQALFCPCLAGPEDDWDDDADADTANFPGHHGRPKDRCTAHHHPQHYRT
jgi:hypothetical protein